MGEQVTEIRQISYSPELTWKTEREITATGGDAAAYTYATSAAGLTDATPNKFHGAMFLCSTGSGTNDTKWRRCDGFDPGATPTADTAYFQGDPWAADPSADKFKIHFVPKMAEAGKLTRKEVFASRKGYKSGSLNKKYKDAYIRTDVDLAFALELNGPGYKASYGEVEAAPAPSTTTFKVLLATTLYQVGQSILINNTTDSLLRRRITAIDSSTMVITVTPAMPHAPTAADKVFGLSAPGECGVLMAGCMGSTLNAGRGDAVQASPAPTTTAFTVLDGTQFVAGCYIGVTVGTGVEWTQVTAVATNALTVSPALSSIPSAGAVVYNAWTIQPADTSHESFTLTSYEHAVKRVLLGCRGTFKIEGIETDEAIPKVSFEFMAGADETLSDASIPSDWTDAMDNFDPPAAVGNFLQIDPAAANTASKEFSNASFSLGSEVSRRKARSATAGIANVSVTGWKECTLQVRINKDTLATYNPITAMEAGTLQRVRLILGGTPGRTVIIDMKEAQTMAVSDEESDGRDYWGVTFEAKDTRSNTRPAFVIALA